MCEVAEERAGLARADYETYQWLNRSYVSKENLAEHDDG
jgi:hypothetical protein